MTASSYRGVSLILAAAFLSGCGKDAVLPPASPDTGAEAVAKTFFEALVREDWTAAYDTIDATSRARLTKEQFAKSAKAAITQLGFKPTEVGVAVSETGDHASAVAVYRGSSGTSSKQYKDGTSMKRSDHGWGVVLRSNFGKQVAVPPSKAKPGGKG